LTGEIVDSREFASIRKELGKTQKQLAQILGISLKAVCSYEQGWRKIPVHIERHLLLLASRKCRDQRNGIPCWKVKNCPRERREGCPAWEFGLGTLCWFVSGTMCEGKNRRSWEEKMKICRKCEYFTSLGKKDGEEE